MNILALDLGDTCGWAWIGQSSEKTQNPEVSIDSSIACIDYGHFSSKTFSPWAKSFLDLLERFSVDTVVCSQTNSFGHMNAARKMFMRFGIVCYLMEKREIPVVELNDSQARKVLLGKGGGKKADAHKLFDLKFPEFSGATGDEKDALALALSWQILNKES